MSSKSLPSGLTWLDPRVGTGFAKKDMLNQKSQGAVTIR
jgi:hypothetical protein